MPTPGYGSSMWRMRQMPTRGGSILQAQLLMAVTLVLAGWSRTLLALERVGGQTGAETSEAAQMDHVLGWASYQVGDMARAKCHFQAHVGSVPTADDSWFGLGEVAIEENRLRDAESALRRAFDLAGDGLAGRPMRTKALVRLGDVSVLGERFAEAVDLFEEALVLRPEQHEVWSKLASTYERVGRERDAAAARDRAAALRSVSGAPVSYELRVQG
jgi:predicted Zn-dependent protease